MKAHTIQQDMKQNPKCSKYYLLGTQTCDLQMKKAQHLYVMDSVVGLS